MGRAECFKKASSIVDNSNGDAWSLNHPEHAALMRALRGAAGQPIGVYRLNTIAAEAHKRGVSRQSIYRELAQQCSQS